MDSEKTKQPLILVDGSSFLYRALYAAPDFRTSDGTPTGTIFTMINMLKSLFKKHRSDRVAIIFDAKGKTFRHEIYPEYKSNRPLMPDELRSSISPIHQIIKHLGFPIISIPGVEADDVIGAITIEATKKGIPVLISTGDKDMAQLVNNNVTLINTMLDGRDSYTTVFSNLAKPIH